MQTNAAPLKFTVYFARRVASIRDYLPKLCQHIFARWGVNIGPLLDSRVRDNRERLIFAALGEIATERYPAREDFISHGLSLASLAEAACRYSRRSDAPKNLTDLENHLESRDFLLYAQEVTRGIDPPEKPSRPLIVSIRTDKKESPPPGFDVKYPNALFFDNEGHPAFVEWDMPSLGETQHEGLFFHQPVVQRDSIDRIGTVTLVSGRREKRPQAKLRQPDDFISAGFRCDFCDQKKVAGPQTEYGEMSPEEWLNQGPFIAGYLNPLEYHDSLKVFSGTNLFAVMQYHKVVLPDRHPRSHSILDLSPAMLIALYHGTHATMRTILENFPDQGIDQVIAGHNFGTSENPFPSGATIKHPHTQVGAINTYIPHISNALGRRVRRYNARGIDFLEGYLTALRQAGLVFYEDRHVAMYVPFAPLFKDEIQVMAKRREAGNPLMLTPQEEGHINFSIALSILGLARFKAPGADGRFVSTGVKSFNTFYMGRRTTEKEGNEGLRMLWTITPRQAHLGLAELQGHYIVSRNPKESAQLMQRALNNLMLPLLVKGEYAKTEGETELLADFITRRPDFARLYQLDAPAQVEAARLLLREIYPLI